MADNLLNLFSHKLFAPRYLQLLWYGLECRSAERRNEKRQHRDWQMNTLPATLSTLNRNNLNEGHSAQVLSYASRQRPTHNTLTVCLFSQITNEPEIDYYILSVHEDRDTALLSLVKSFIQCGPQMVLQIYLLVRHSPNFNTTIGIITTILFSRVDTRFPLALILITNS